jgi:hypothetical protein
MYDLGLRSLVLVIVTDNKEFFMKDLKDTFGQELVLCTLKIIHVNYDDFFSFKY